MSFMNDVQWAEICRLCQAAHDAVQAGQRVVVDDQVVDSITYTPGGRGGVNACWWFDHTLTEEERRECEEHPAPLSEGVIYFARDGRFQNIPTFEQTVKNLKRILRSNKITPDGPRVRRVVLACEDSNGFPSLVPFKVEADDQAVKSGDYLEDVRNAADARGYGFVDYALAFEQSSHQWAELSKMFKWAEVEISK